MQSSAINIGIKRATPLGEQESLGQPIHQPDAVEIDTEQANANSLPVMNDPKAACGSNMVANQITTEITQPQEEELLAFARMIANKWALYKSIPQEQLPQIDIDKNNLLPCIAPAGYSSTHDTIFLNPRVLKKFPWILRKIIPHEETHAQGAKSRTRLKLQHHEMYISTIKELMIDCTLGGEIGSILSDLTFEEKREGEKSRRIKTCTSMKAPYYTTQMRQKIADTLKIFFDNHNTLFTTPEETTYELPKLTTDELQMVSSLLDDSDFNKLIEQHTYHDELDSTQNHAKARNQANDTLVRYFEAMLLRTGVLYSTGAMSKAVQNLVPTTPMTDTEIESAKESLKGYLSTLEGNLKVQHPESNSSISGPTEEETFGYTLGASEERQAEINAAEFQLNEIDSGVVHTQGPSRANLEADTILMGLANRYIEILKRIDLAPKSIEAIREINKLKHRLRLCNQRSDIVKERSKRIHKELWKRLEEAPEVTEGVVVETETGTSTTRDIGIQLSDKDRRVLDEENNLSEEAFDLELSIGEKSSCTLSSSDEHKAENEKLLAERKEILIAMHKVAPYSTSLSLPRIVFETDEDHTAYNNKLTNLVGGAEQVLGMVIVEGLERNQFKKIEGVFGKGASSPHQ